MDPVVAVWFCLDTDDGTEADARDGQDADLPPTEVSESELDRPVVQFRMSSPSIQSGRAAVTDMDDTVPYRTTSPIVVPGTSGAEQVGVLSAGVVGVSALVAGLLFRHTFVLQLRGESDDGGYEEAIQELGDWLLDLGIPCVGQSLANRGALVQTLVMHFLFYR